MAWTMRVTKVEAEYHVFIGAVKIAEICFNKRATRWVCYLRLMRNYAAYDVHDHYESMSDALKHLHRLLNDEPKEKD